MFRICSSCRQSILALETTTRAGSRRFRSSGNTSNNALNLDFLQPFSQKSVRRPPLVVTPASTRPPTGHFPRRGPSHASGSKGFSQPYRQTEGGRGGGYHNHQQSLIPKITPSSVIPYFEANVISWCRQTRTLKRLESFGFPLEESKRLLVTFADEVQSGLLSDSKHASSYNLDRFAQTHDDTSIDSIYSTIFFSWLTQTDPPHRSRVVRKAKVSDATLALADDLVEATSRQSPADGFTFARAMHRKVIMHVGPTNSGKTYHALRALAAAKTGVYASPLRLLAHEIWERLNTGQIRPLGMEEDPADAQSSSGGNLKWARQCNMVTGEEQKIMGENVGLLSCTVEMLGYNTKSDVAVVDEIQMLGDPDRGAAWTDAVLGLPARELHLCGEETVIPIVEQLLRDTGDELIIQRYERLTPLAVEEESLQGDFTNIRKGDCIVTFSRSNIFGIKKLVEEKTGMRCAVVYGRLPPEVRSEQAALFNDPDSGYDVIIGSDAIGMGLNLKIKRVVFEALGKFQAGRIQPLSVSSVKQIAGRAGRYGLHADAGGSTTTLHPQDMAYLKECLDTPYVSVDYGRLMPSKEGLCNTMSILPTDASLETTFTAHTCIGQIPPYLRYCKQDQMSHIYDLVDNEWSDMPMGAKMLLMWAPVPWRDKNTVEIVKKCLMMFSETMSVDFKKAVEGTTYIPLLEDMEAKMKAPPPENGDVDVPRASDKLMLLESFHKAAVFYLWMSFRLPVAYSDFNGIYQLKERIERVLNWLLDVISKKEDLHHFQKQTAKGLRVSAKAQDHSPRRAELKYTNKLEIQKIRLARQKMNDVNEMVPAMSAAPASSLSSSPSTRTLNSRTQS
ncbi:P-loop containing nucleoside triphosphate hydrolase protein [Panaeolus papilionaceus]|nr:P-loop containing nucleoside triphosphate hydrolase protein [Panaeolus papilionaceus]